MFCCVCGLLVASFNLRVCRTENHADSCCVRLLLRFEILNYGTNSQSTVADDVTEEMKSGILLA